MSEAGHFERWDAASDEEHRAVLDRFRAYTAAVAERGEVLGGEALARPAEARTLRAGAVSEGPYADTAEQLGGFYLVELPSLDDAVALARLLPAAYAVEVRPVVAP